MRFHLFLAAQIYGWRARCHIYVVVVRTFFVTVLKNRAICQLRRIIDSVGCITYIKWNRIPLHLCLLFFSLTTRFLITTKRVYQKVRPSIGGYVCKTFTVHPTRSNFVTKSTDELSQGWIDLPSCWVFATTTTIHAKKTDCFGVDF